MFQDFKDRSNPRDAIENLGRLRAALSNAKLAGIIIPREDEYQGEYVPACNERLKWATGFGGSAGLTIIMATEAALFVDGRYTLQARSQIDMTVFEVVHTAEQRPTHWLKQRSLKGAQIGIDPRLHSLGAYRSFDAAITAAGGTLHILNENPVDTLWTKRPLSPRGDITIQPENLAGRSIADKTEELLKSLAAAHADRLIISQPENIAWLLNIRGQDVPHTPFVLSYAVLNKSGLIDWYVDPSRINADLAAHLTDRVIIHAPAQLEADLRAMKSESIMLDPSTTPAWFAQMLDQASLIEKSDPIALPKSRKNKAEIDGAERAHLLDGVALCKFLHWITQETGSNSVTEIDAVKQLEAFRAASGKLLDISFDTIAGSGPHGAIVHYRVTESTDRIVKDGDLFLLDSGGQYRDGTTDVTRTILIGNKASDDAVNCFTTVLRGHIALAMAHFPAGTNGGQLDTLARAPLWEKGWDFDHGTGHGVGSYLSVHEGPQRISKGSNVALEPGMIVSNEPGYYRTDAFGIRIESLQYVTHAAPVGERPMLRFEVLTLAPIDRSLIDRSQLAPSELAWLNAYHARVFKMISPHLTETESNWLAAQCAPL